MTVAYLSVLVMGFVLGLLGGGGSILTVPILIYLFHLDAVMATGYSLFIVGVTAAFGAFRNYQMKRLNLKVASLFFLPGFLGVLASRALILPLLPETIYEFEFYSLTKDTFILLVFSLMMILASFSMILGRSESSSPKALSNLSLLVLGFVVGILTGFVGAGGGFILIPALNKWAGLNMKESIGTSLFIITVNSLLGFLGDLTTLSPDWWFLISLSALAVLGTYIGVSFNDRVPAKKLKKGFGVFVLLVGSMIIYQQL